MESLICTACNFRVVLTTVSLEALDVLSLIKAVHMHNTFHLSLYSMIIKDYSTSHIEDQALNLLIAWNGQDTLSWWELIDGREIAAAKSPPWWKVKWLDTAILRDELKLGY